MMVNYPFPIFLALVGVVIFVTPLALLPGFPASKAAKVFWLIGVLHLAGNWVWFGLRPFFDRWSPWVPPVWFPALSGLTYVLLPVATSIFLWRARLKDPQRLTGGAASLGIVAVCLFSFFAFKTFGETCVFFDARHDHGQAWCPSSWQARLWGQPVSPPP